MPTLLAAAGVPDIKEKLLTGYKIGKTNFKVHLDGYNLLPYLTGEEAKSPRKEFFYFSDDGDLTGLRYDNWKLVFAEQRAPGTLRVWAEPLPCCACRCSTICGSILTSAPASPRTPITTGSWTTPSSLLPAQKYVGQFLATFKDFPPRQKAASFSIDQVMEKLKQPMHHD